MYKQSQRSSATATKRPCGCGGKGSTNPAKPCGCGKTAAASSSTSAKPCGCGGKGSTNPAKPCTCGCTSTACFERPRFFAGQLLSDCDLSAEQRYVREKQKLYHRTLDGHGVVCGLRLSCDIGCCGHIRIGDGFAIDDCGNDIVVCNPYSFDAIGMLKEKGWLIEPPHHHHHHDKEQQPASASPAPAGPSEGAFPEPKPEHSCDIIKCYHVVICYEEQQSCFVTPFKTTCGSGTVPADCEATRIEETFSIDLRKEAPQRWDPMSDLQERIKACWEVFTKGEFGHRFLGLVEALLIATEPKGKPEDVEKREDTAPNYCDYFCQLQTFFLHHLSRCPDLYDCTLSEKVCRLRCCAEDCRSFDPCRHPIVALFNLARRYVYESILGEMIFSCSKPCKSECVQLGSIEVRNGRLERVCNGPREYVKSWPNLFQVLVATHVGARSCCPPEEAHKPDRRCVEGEENDFRQMLLRFKGEPNWGELTAGASAIMVENVIRAFEQSLDFTQSLAITRDLLKEFEKKGIREGNVLPQKSVAEVIQSAGIAQVVLTESKSADGGPSMNAAPGPSTPQS